jgi:hypothetical protein
MFKTWGWLDYFHISIQFVVTAVNITGRVVVVQCAVEECKCIYMEAYSI